jgi:hypothetical protein
MLDEKELPHELVFVAWLLCKLVLAESRLCSP